MTCTKCRGDGFESFEKAGYDYAAKCRTCGGTGIVPDVGSLLADIGPDPDLVAAIPFAAELMGMPGEPRPIPPDKESPGLEPKLTLGGGSK